MKVIFLSTVSKEFRSYRDLLATRLRRPGITTHVQEDFITTGFETLDKLDDYIRDSDSIIHLIGDMTGAPPPVEAVLKLVECYPDLRTHFARIADIEDILSGKIRLSYTQWEALLAHYHGKELLIYRAADIALRDVSFLADGNQAKAQRDHEMRLNALERFADPNPFTSPDNLLASVLSGAIVNLLSKAIGRQPNTLPFITLGTLFKGRDSVMNGLKASLETLSIHAICGLGGIGKTRLAIEYAWVHAERYSALLFISAETSETLRAGLSALVGPDQLDLPEKDALADDVRVPAALGWLARHTTWLMILDNVDSKEARKAVQDLLPKLRGGHVLITGRLADYAAGIGTLQLDRLSADAASTFLTERTGFKRPTAADDDTAKAALIHELDGLALGLEQAGAYIAVRRITYIAYLNRWKASRAQVLSWFDRDAMSYNRDVGLATTWATSVEQLSPHGRFLLDRLAYLAPEPIPLFLLSTQIRDAPENFEPEAALAELYELSLADGPTNGSFSVHRLVQDFTRRAMDTEAQGRSINSTLYWLLGGFGDDSEDFRSWPRLESLTPHVSAVIAIGKATTSLIPIVHLMNQLGQFYRHKSLFEPAESLYREALALLVGRDEVDPATHSLVLNNLAQLLQATKRLGEAEQLLHKALAISKAAYGADDPAVAVRLGNLAQLFHDTKRFDEAEPLMQEALRIGLKIHGPNDARIAIRLTNLARLLADTGRHKDAQAMMHQALAIEENVYGPNHPHSINLLNNLGASLRDSNRLEDAEKVLSRCLSILIAFNQATDSVHPRINNVVGNFAELLDKMGRSDAAIKAIFAKFGIVIRKSPRAS